LGQEHITKEARGCLHFDLAKASADIEDTQLMLRHDHFYSFKHHADVEPRNFFGFPGSFFDF
jgi:hypothetical protein